MARPAVFGPLAAGGLDDRLGSDQLAFWLTAGAFVIAARLVLATSQSDRVAGVRAKVQGNSCVYSRAG